MTNLGVFYWQRILLWNIGLCNVFDISFFIHGMHYTFYNPASISIMKYFMQNVYGSKTSAF